MYFYNFKNLNFVTCCYIDWYDKWPEEAILSIGIKEISTIDNPAIIKLR